MRVKEKISHNNFEVVGLSMNKYITNGVCPQAILCVYVYMSLCLCISDVCG